MIKHSDIVEKLMFTCNKINEKGKIPRDYGCGFLIYQSEIHAIQAIMNHGMANASELAKILGITNGAVTQIINKLSNKNLVTRYYLSHNKKEIYYQLTPVGKIAFEGHEKYHDKINSKVIGFLNELGEEQIQTINDFFDKFNEQV